MIAQKLKRRKEAHDQMRSIVDKARKERRDLTNSEFEAFNDLDAEIKNIDFEVSPDQLYKNYTSRQLLEFAVESREEKNHEAANMLFWLYAQKEAQIFHEKTKRDRKIMEHPERHLNGEPFKTGQSEKVKVYGVDEAFPL